MSTIIDEETHIKSIKARISYKEFVIMMAALMATNSIAIDIMLPALNEITGSLNVQDPNDQHYIIFCYLIGFGLFQLLIGPLSDRFGRRLPMIAGLIFYSLSSIACAFAPNFISLLVLRVIQGFGGAVTRVLTVSIVRDIYGGRKMAEVMSIVMMVFMMVPLVAPSIGQAIMFFHHWQLIFLFMGVAGSVIAIWAYFRMPETLYQPRPLSVNVIAKGFGTVLSNKTSICYTLAFTVILGGLFGALNTAQQIYDGIYHLGVWFPAAFALVAAFQALSSFLNSRFVYQYGMRVISHSLLLIQITAAFIWVTWSLLTQQDLPFFFYMVLFIIVMFSFGGMAANFGALSMEPLGKLAGTASAVFGFIQTILGAALGFFISQQFNGTTTPIALGFLVLGIVALICVLIAENGRLFQQTNHSTVTTIEPH